MEQGTVPRSTQFYTGITPVYIWVERGTVPCSISVISLFLRITAGLLAAHELAPAFGHIAAAFRAAFVGRLLP